MSTPLRPLAAVVAALLVAGGTAACTDLPAPEPTTTATATEPAGSSPEPTTTSPSPEPTTTAPQPEPATSPAPEPATTPVPYDPESDYADATLDELREYVAANDQLIEAAIPSFELFIGASPEPAQQDLLDRARQVAAAVDPSIELGDDELRPLLDAQEQVLADMAG